MSDFVFGNPQKAQKEQTNLPPIFLESVQALRRDIDSLIGGLCPGIGDSLEITTARMKLEESRMWLGNTLRELNYISPYKALEIQRGFGNTKEIAERADKGPSIPFPSEPIDLCDYLRGLIDKKIIVCKDLYQEFSERFYDRHWGIVYMEQSVIALVMARNYLGLELGRLRDGRNV